MNEMTEQELEAINYLAVKNQIITMSKSELEKIYNDNSSNFKNLISGVELILKNEPAIFLMLKDAMLKVRNLISDNRMKNIDKVNQMNDILIKLNELENISNHDKIVLLNDYICSQYAKRELPNNLKKDGSNSMDINLLVNDIIVYKAIWGKYNEPIELHYIYSTICYFINTMPELFTEDFKNQILNAISAICNNISNSKKIKKKEKKNYITIFKSLGNCVNNIDQNKNKKTYTK